MQQNGSLADGYRDSCPRALMLAIVVIESAQSLPKRRCLSDKGGGGARQRRCLSREGGEITKTRTHPNQPVEEETRRREEVEERGNEGEKTVEERRQWRTEDSGGQKILWCQK